MALTYTSVPVWLATAPPPARTTTRAGPVDPAHEVWPDFTVEPGRPGWAETSVPFVVPPGAAHSIVIHALPTDEAGQAGGRVACLPVEF
jgi:hypothetical protein